MTSGFFSIEPHPLLKPVVQAQTKLEWQPDESIPPPRLNNPARLCSSYNRNLKGKEEVV